MTPKLHHSIMALLLCVLCASVAQTKAQTALDRFPQFDKNADGRLTREEFPAAKIFDAADADKDSCFTKDEESAHHLASRLTRSSRWMRDAPMMPSVARR